MSSSPTETRVVDVAMPQMGVSVAEGTIVAWHKQPSATGSADEEPIGEITTDKIDTEVPSPATGRLREILVEAGVTVDVGTPLARIATDARPGEPHVSEHPGNGGAAAPEPTSEAAAATGRTPAPATATPAPEPAAASRTTPRSAGATPRSSAHRRRARHRPLAGPGHRPRRPRAQAGRARAPRRRRRRRRPRRAEPPLHIESPYRPEPVPPRRRAGRAGPVGRAAPRPRRRRRRRRRAARGRRRTAGSRSRACAARSAST